MRQKNNKDRECQAITEVFFNITVQQKNAGLQASSTQVRVVVVVVFFWRGGEGITMI